ncbi:MAG: aspartyl protease family protein [candidate division Zixibacteria bacterium]|nr:aspartyl protease family protein [candidate division Zixibacteria bacterium]
MSLLTIPVAEAIDLDSLFEVSIGGPQARARLDRLVSYHAAGTVNISGLMGHFEEFFVPPDKFYLEVDFEHFNMVQAYDGQAAWQKDHNGFVSELEGYEKVNFLGEIYFSSYSYLFPRRIDGSYEYLGRAVKDGIKCHEVAFYPLNEDTVKVYFDINTGLRRFSTGKLDNLMTLAVIDDYRDVSGIMIPFHSRAETQVENLFTEFTIESVKLDEPFDPGIFSKPTVITADYKFPDDKEFVTIPFDYRLGHIYLKAVINGKKSAWFILDSGASGNIYHTAILDDLSLPLVGSLPAKGIGGFDEVQLVRSDSVTIGELTLYNQVSGVSDLTGIGLPGRDGLPFGGVLGYDLLSRFPLMVDYRDSTLTVFNPDSFTPPDSGHMIPFQLTMQVPTIKAELNGIPGSFIIDLGNPFSLIIHKNFVESNKLDEKLDDIRDISGEYGGVGGTVKGKTAYAAVFGFGDIRIQSLLVVLPGESEGISGSEKIAGNIGNLLLERFRVLFDYPRNRVIFYDPEK